MTKWDFVVQHWQSLIWKSLGTIAKSLQQPLYFRQIVCVLSEMIHQGVFACGQFLKCILAAQRPTVPAGPLGVLDVHADRGGMERAGRAEQDSGWGGKRVSSDLP